MGLRGPKARGQEDWMKPVAELMIQEHMNFSAACQALGVKFDDSAAERAARYCEAFRSVLSALEMRYYALDGDNPLLTKGVLAGILMDALRRLRELDQPDKVAMPGKLLADLMGWLSEAPEKVTEFGLTQTQIDELRAKVEEEQKKQSQVQQITVVVDGSNPN